MRLPIRWISPRRGFTLVEAIMAGTISAVITGALLLALSSSRRTEEMTTLYLDLLESSALAVHQLRSDLRQLMVVPGLPVKDHSILVRNTDDPLRRALRFRRSLLLDSAALQGAACSFVDYQLVRSDRRPERFHLVRTESMPVATLCLPGRKTSSESTVFRSFLLKDMDFSYLADEVRGARVLHILLEVVSDTPATDRTQGPFGEKSLVLTSVVAVQRPELPCTPRPGDPYFFADLLPADVPVETPLPTTNVRLPPQAGIARLDAPPDVVRTR